MSGELELRPVVVSLCDLSGIMVEPWAAVGFECWCIDIQHSIRALWRKGNITFAWGDVRTWCPPESIRGRIRFVFAFPPCTHVANSGRRDFRIKGTAMLRDSLEIFAACEHAAKWAGVPYMIENPVGKFSDHMGDPDIIIQPWYYGDMWVKRTCLWTGNGFKLPERIHYVRPPSVDLKKIWHGNPLDHSGFRSETPPKFARAVFKANYNHEHSRINS